jgi:hypothetical protein
LREVKRYPPEKFRFMSPVDLANYVKSTGILDLLVKASGRVRGSIIDSDSSTE